MAAKKSAKGKKPAAKKRTVKCAPRPAKSVSAGPITKDTPVYDLVQKYPEAVPVLFEHGMHCLGCSAAQFETIGQAADAHGIDSVKLIEDLNKALKKKK